jgi:hypothetical protein
MEEHTTAGAPTPHDIHELIAAQRQQQADKEAGGIPALRRLVEVAQKNSGQSRHIRRFLLGIYNAHAWPFELNRLRNLDASLQADALAVLQMDMTARREVHLYIEDGDGLWREWWYREEAFDADNETEG